MKRAVLGLMGDVMIGRLVNEYLDVAPMVSIWGDLVEELHRTDLNIANLETALTFSEKEVPKVFNFKADPRKVEALSKGRIDLVNLANNHILDFGESGLAETIKTLDQAKIFHVGAGSKLSEAKAPVIIEKNGIKIGVIGCTDNEPSWQAKEGLAGTNFIDVSDPKSLIKEVKALRGKVDILIVSIHWGPNMRERPNRQFIEFAHALIDNGVNILHGHSAHIFQGIEEYHKGLILYDTGDFVDDYYVDPYLRNDRTFFYQVEITDIGVESFHLIPCVIDHFQVRKAKGKERVEIMERMEALSSEFATTVKASH